MYGPGRAKILPQRLPRHKRMDTMWSVQYLVAPMHTLWSTGFYPLSFASIPITITDGDAAEKDGDGDDRCPNEAAQNISGSRIAIAFTLTATLYGAEKAAGLSVLAGCRTSADSGTTEADAADEQRPNADADREGDASREEAGAVVNREPPRHVFALAYGTDEFNSKPSRI